MASKILLAPTENSLKQELGKDAIISSLCEEKGADILIYSSKGLVGLQRKSVPNDFISSFTDGRFARLLPLLTSSCSFYRVVCEGSLKFWPDGTVHLGMTKSHKRVPSRFNRSHIHGMINDLEFIYGIQVHWTEDVKDTVRYIESIQRFMSADKHVGLFTRPKAQSAWIVPSNEDIHLWILQSFNGIGVSTASKIIEKFGKAPLRWTCTIDDLCSIPGVSVKAASQWLSCLNNTEIDKIQRDKRPLFANFSNKLAGQRSSAQNTASSTKQNVSTADSTNPRPFDYLRDKLRKC